MLYSPLLALAAVAPLARAQQQVNGTYVTGLVSVLQTAGLNQLAGAAQGAMSTPGGQILLSQISQGQKTIFAPNDKAFSGVPSSVTGNASLVGSILTYHLLSGSFPASSIATLPNHTLARTYLSDTSLVNLEGNKTQVVAFAVDPQLQKTRILNQNTNVTITNTLTYENLLIHVVDAVIDVPGNFTSAARAHNLNRVTALVNQVNLDEAIDNSKGITIFAPRDAAFTAVESVLATLNQTQVTTILANHVINGTTVYSTLLTQGSFVSAAGAPYTFAYNSSGAFVTSGTSTARVVESDILIENGVIHIIDGVLANTNSDAQAASSAYQGYTSSAAAAATQTTGNNLNPAVTETGAVGGTNVPSSSGAVPLALGGDIKQLAVVLGAVLAGAALIL